MAEERPQGSQKRAGRLVARTRGGVIEAEDLNEMSEADRALASKFGYKPVFKRQFGYLATFSFAVSIGGVYSSIATTFIYPLQAGGSASVVWCTCPCFHLRLVILRTLKAGLSRVRGACALRYVNRTMKHGSIGAFFGR